MPPKPAKAAPYLAAAAVRCLEGGSKIVISVQAKPNARHSAITGVGLRFARLRGERFILLCPVAWVWVVANVESWVTGIGQEAVGVAINAPARDGEANEELVSFIAQVRSMNNRTSYPQPFASHHLSPSSTLSPPLALLYRC